MNNNDLIAVLIPVYNEASTIEKVVREFKQELPDALVVVCDNNSTDNSARLAQAAGAVVLHERRQGKGNVMRTLFRSVQADCYVMVDGDDTYPPAAVHKMCSLVLDRGYDMVIGDRLSSTYYRQNKRRFHNGGNRLVRSLVSLIFGKMIHVFDDCVKDSKNHESNQIVSVGGGQLSKQTRHRYHDRISGPKSSFCQKFSRFIARL